MTSTADHVLSLLRYPAFLPEGRASGVPPMVAQGRAVYPGKKLRREKNSFQISGGRLRRVHRCKSGIMCELTKMP
ncbi:MAG TPA: hypothetical protein DCX03_04480 [Bacteroidales bacterium]|nr:hypothetical protein [Bacteroidales bacterium]